MPINKKPDLLSIRRWISGWAWEIVKENEHWFCKQHKFYCEENDWQIWLVNQRLSPWGIFESERRVFSGIGKENRTELFISN